MNSKAFLETIDIAIQVFWFPSCQRLIRSWTLSLISWFRWMQTSLLRTISTRKSRKMERNRKRWKKSFKLKRTRMMYVDIESQALVRSLADFIEVEFEHSEKSWWISIDLCSDERQNRLYQRGMHSLNWYDPFVANCSRETKHHQSGDWNPRRDSDPSSTSAGPWRYSQTGNSLFYLSLLLECKRYRIKWNFPRKAGGLSVPREPRQRLPCSGEGSRSEP